MLVIIETTLEKYIDDSSYRANWLVEDLTATEYQVLNTVMKYIDKNDFITTEIATKLVKKSSSTTRRYMAKSSELGILESIGSNKDKRYYK